MYTCEDTTTSGISRSKHTADGLIGCVFVPVFPHDQESANARLMAAAPELYAALSALVAEVCDLEAFERFAPFVEAAEDALRKAEWG